MGKANLESIEPDHRRYRGRLQTADAVLRAASRL